MSQQHAAKNWQINVFYDGDCPLCRREITFLKRLDRHDRILFTNIASAKFDAGDYDLTMDELMAEIHGLLPDGRTVKGVEVFRRLYDAVGFGGVVAITRMKPVAATLELGYRWFAKHRLKLTGRCDDTSCQAAA